MNKILFISNNERDGGGNYERLVYDILSQQFEINPYFIKSSPKSIIPNKFYIYNQLRKINGKYKLLITNNTFIYGLDLSVAKYKVLIFHHLDNEKVINKFMGRYLLTQLQRFNKIVCVAEYWKNFLLNCKVYDDSLDNIYNSFEVNQFNYIKKDREYFCNHFNIPKDKIIVYAGNSSFIKGTDRIVNNLDREKYFIITSGSKNQEYNTLHLNLDYNEYINLLANVDVTVILTRLKEGWNRIAHESILSGTPVIGSNIAGLSELLQKSQQVIYNPHLLLSEQIDFVMNNRKTLADKGLKYCSEFDMNYFKEKWTSLVERFMSQ